MNLILSQKSEATAHDGVYLAERVPVSTDRDDQGNGSGESGIVHAMVANEGEECS